MLYANVYPHTVSKTQQIATTERETWTDMTNTDESTSVYTAAPANARYW